MSLDFLPAWPPEINTLVIFGLVLWAGLVGGEIAHRSRYVPRITGYIAIGFLLGPSVLDVFTRSMVAGAGIFVDTALGLILFQIGRRLHVPSLRNDRAVLATALAECSASFAAAYWVLAAFDFPPVHAAIAAAIGISSSPAVMLLVMREFDAQGPVSDRALTLIAINNLLAFFFFIAILPWLHQEQRADWVVAVLHPLYQVAGSLLLAYLLAHLTIRLGQLIGHRDSAQFALLVGVIVLAVGTAQALHVSILLTLLALGVLCRNLDRRQALLEVEFGHGGDIFFVVLFVVAGANLHLEELARGGLLAVAFVLARFIAKSAVVFVAGRYSGLSPAQAFGLGLSLVPMAAMAIGLLKMTEELYPGITASLTTTVLAAIAILETVGPLAALWGLRLAGEIKPDARLDH
jgi:Kef-type K+ transport system membrane component KefB